jgi:hypothetical protein
MVFKIILGSSCSYLWGYPMLVALMLGASKLLTMTKDIGGSVLLL